MLCIYKPESKGQVGKYYLLVKPHLLFTKYNYANIKLLTNHYYMITYFTSTVYMAIVNIADYYAIATNILLQLPDIKD